MMLPNAKFKFLHTINSKHLSFLWAGRLDRLMWEPTDQQWNGRSRADGTAEEAKVKERRLAVFRYGSRSSCDRPVCTPAPFTQL